MQAAAMAKGWMGVAVETAVETTLKKTVETAARKGAG
jgi:hypothetical protein